MCTCHSGHRHHVCALETTTPDYEVVQKESDRWAIRTGIGEHLRAGQFLLTFRLRSEARDLISMLDNGELE